MKAYIFYAKKDSEWFDNINFTSDEQKHVPTVKNILEDYIQVDVFDTDKSLRTAGGVSKVAEKIFAIYNDYTLNPLSAQNSMPKQNLLRISGAGHTSMTVGDAILIGDKFYIADMVGFIIVPLKEEK